MVICHCENVSSAVLSSVIASGADTIEAIESRCGAGGGCGRCWSQLEALLADRADRHCGGEVAA